MKFYISAKWELRNVVAKMQKHLIKKGHTITTDWTNRAYSRDYDKNPKQSSEYSLEETNAILNSDILIHLSDFNGKGKYVDLGIALAGNNLQGKPLIYVVGTKANESQFYFNPAIKRKINPTPTSL